MVVSIGNEFLSETHFQMVDDLSSQVSENEHFKPSGATESSEQSHLLNVPYDVMRVIYKTLYPIGHNLQLTYGPSTWDSQRPKPYNITAGAMSLLRICRQINEEVVNILYETNNFLLAPGEVNYHKRLRYPHANSGLFLSHLRSTVRSTIRKLQLYFGVSLRNGTIDKLVNVIVDFPVVEIAVVALSSHRGASGAIAKLRNCLQEACRRIAVARGGGLTVWDDSGDQQTALLLSSAMPTGYTTLD